MVFHLLLAWKNVEQIVDMSVISDAMTLMCRRYYDFWTDYKAIYVVPLFKDGWCNIMNIVGRSLHNILEMVSKPSFLIPWICYVIYIYGIYML